VFAKRVHKLKRCTNLIPHDENYTSFVVSLLIHKMEGKGEGPNSRGWGVFIIVCGARGGCGGGGGGGGGVIEGGGGGGR